MTEDKPVEYSFDTKRILIIDDDPDVLAMTGLRLKQAGYKYVLKSESAVRALKLIEDSPPDLILCDWRMPEMTGIELLTILKGQRSINKEMPFIMLTSVQEKAQVMEALKLGITDYITKPVLSSILVSKVNAAFKAQAEKLNSR